MTRFRLLVPVVLVAFAVLLAGCSKDEAPSSDAPTPDRADVVAALVENVVLPANAAVASSAAASTEAVAALCAGPTDATLDAARAAVAVGWGEWRSTDSFDLGPAMKRRSTSVVSYKVDVDKVDATLAATPPTDPETVRNRTSSSLRGYGAAWHLLTADAATFATQPTRCDYLTAVLSVVADETKKVDDGWTAGLDGAPAFRDTATGTGEGALSPTDVIDSVVNMQLSQLESTSKLLTAAAEVAPGTPPDLPVGELFQLAAQTRGIRDSYTELGQLLKADLRSEIDEQLTALEELLADAAEAPTETPPDVATSEKVAAAVEELRVTIATEVVSALDVTISFSENDGDS